MGTTLQGMGMPAGRPADAWLESRPEAIAAVHARSVAAGATVVRTATLCTRPDRDRDAFARRVDVAIGLARSSGAEEVWWSIGPAGPSRGPLHALAGLADLPVDAILLETFVDPEEALQTLAAVYRTDGPPVVVSMVPGPDGALLDGSPLPHAALRRAGAAGVGANCGGSPTDVLRAIEGLPPGGPWMAAPVAGPGLEQVLAQLAPRCRWLGACCGVTPETLEAAWPD